MSGRDMRVIGLKTQKDVHLHKNKEKKKINYSKRCMVVKKRERIRYTAWDLAFTNLEKAVLVNPILEGIQTETKEQSWH